MLPPITKKYFDYSTPKYFSFAFLCDSCASPWESEKYPFSLRDAPPQNASEEAAREILWKAEHDAAYERANNEAAFHFNGCPNCGRRVCDDCFSVFDDICARCAENRD